MLAGAESQVANIRVRSQGTIGGNLCFNDPHSDPATALLVYDASVTIHGPNGARQMPLQGFLRGMYCDRAGARRVARVDRCSVFTGKVRQLLFAHSSASTADADRRRGRVSTQWRHRRSSPGGWMRRAHGFKTDRARSEDPGRAVRTTFAKLFDETKTYLKKALEPIDDLLGSAEYKLYIAGVLLERALAQALENVEKKQDERNG